MKTWILGKLDAHTAPASCTQGASKITSTPSPAGSADRAEGQVTEEDAAAVAAAAAAAAALPAAEDAAWVRGTKVRRFAQHQEEEQAIEQSGVPTVG